MIKRLEHRKEIDLYSHLINVTSGQTQPLRLKHTTPSTFLNEMKFIKQLHKGPQRIQMKQKQTKEQNIYDLEEAKDHTACPKCKLPEAAVQQLEVIKCYCASITSNRI